jgi:hypothetical protein
MGINLLRLVLVQADESVQDIIASLSVILTSLVVGEVVLHGADWQLLLESINLVQEQEFLGCKKSGADPQKIVTRKMVTLLLTGPRPP